MYGWLKTATGSVCSPSNPAPPKSAPFDISWTAIPVWQHAEGSEKCTTAKEFRWLQCYAAT